MKCPGCGAGVTQAMMKAGECEYCRTLLAPPPPAAPAAPQVVHITKVEVHAPTFDVVEVGTAAGGLFDSVVARVIGCFSGLLSAALTLGFTAMILAFEGWQVWVSNRNLPTVVPVPTPEEHEHDKEKADRGREEHDKGKAGKKK